MLFVYMLIVLSFLLSYSVFLYFVYDFNNNNNNNDNNTRYAALKISQTCTI